MISNNDNKTKNESPYTIFIPNYIAFYDTFNEYYLNIYLDPIWKYHIKDLILFHIMNYTQIDLISMTSNSNNWNHTMANGENVTIEFQHNNNSTLGNYSNNGHNNNSRSDNKNMNNNQLFIGIVLI